MRQLLGAQHDHHGADDGAHDDDRGDVIDANADHDRKLAALDDAAFGLFGAARAAWQRGDYQHRGRVADEHDRCAAAARAHLAIYDQLTSR